MTGIGGTTGIAGVAKVVDTALCIVGTTTGATNCGS